MINKRTIITLPERIRSGFKNTVMERIGAYEAKTHLPRLLQLLAQGEKIIITRHGVSVATLQAPSQAKSIPARDVIKEIREIRRKHSLTGLSLKELIDEGRG